MVTMRDFQDVFLSFKNLLKKDCIHEHDEKYDVFKMHK